MRNRTLPVLLLALAVLAAGLWLFSRDEERDLPGEPRASRPQASSAPAAADPSAAGRSLAPAEPMDEPQAPEKPALAPQAAGSARVVASTEYEQELARGLWVEGRVLLPPDTPLDERAEVVADGERFEHGPAHRAEVAADGSFRAAFAEGTQSGRLKLEARYLFLDEPLKVKPAAGEPVVLEPRLGGALSGRVIPPPGAAEGPRELVGKLVRLHGWIRDGSRSGVNISRVERLDASLAYTFTGLPPDIPYSLACDAGVYEQADVEEVFVSPGKDTVVDLAVHLGVSVAGRVVDEAGAPLAGAMVIARVASEREGPSAPSRMAQADASGAFALAGISPGALTLEAGFQGYDSLELEFGQLERGAARDGVELRLSRGQSISGRVLLPDGSPAEGAGITVEPEWTEEIMVVRLGGPLQKTDAAGAFTVTGLDPGPHTVVARFTLKEQVVEKSKLLGRERERTVRRTLRATLAGVATGTSGLVLELSDGETVRGSVVDDLGAPVASFQVEVHTVRREGDSTSTSLFLSRSIKDGTGTFELTGLQPGLHRLEFKAEGYSAASSVDFEVPLPADLSPMRLMRAARIAGVVLTPRGEPAPRAHVDTYPDDGSSHSFWNASNGLREGQVLTDQEGRFETDEVEPGKIKLRALAEGCAPSEPLAVELAPGSSLAGITLRLRQGVKLTGLVLGADGKGAPRREVWISQRGPENFFSELRADEDGAFEQDGLAPGLYAVTAYPTEAELLAHGLSSSDDGRNLLSVRAEVEVTEQGGHVVLASNAVQPVRLSGTVLAGGEPASATLYFWSLGQSTGSPAETGEDGSYEVVVPAPGEYRVVIQLQEGGKAGADRRITVKGPAEERFDFDVPVGALEGRVLGPDGPLGGIPVFFFQPLETGNGWMKAYATSDGHGRYAIERLPAGTWTVQAGGVSTVDDATPEAAPYTLAQVAGVLVESGQRVRDVDLQVGAAGVVSGRVLTAQGQPAAGARVFARYPSGALVEAYGLRRTDHNGDFILGGLEPGGYALVAVHGSNAGAEAKVELEAGEEEKLELRLEPATLLRVDVRDKAGAPAALTAYCVRSDGADFTWVRDWNRQAADEQRIGPLPPGTYTLWAEAEGVPSEVKTVALKGEAELLIELVL